MSTRTGVWTRLRDCKACGRDLGVKAATCFPRRSVPAPGSSIQRREVLPDLREVHRVDIPICVSREVPVEGGRSHPSTSPDRRGLCSFPDSNSSPATVCEPWCRPRGEAAAQVAEPLLLPSAFSPRYYPEAIVQVRQPARCRQGDYAVYTRCACRSKPHLQEMPTSVPRPRVCPNSCAETARARLQLSGLEFCDAYEMQLGRGVVDHGPIGFPKSALEDMF